MGKKDNFYWSWRQWNRREAALISSSVGKSTNELLIECFKLEYSAFEFIIAVSSSGTDLQASDPNSWIFTDPASFPLQRKLWNSYFLVVETLDEKQVHIVKQVRRVILKPAETPCSKNWLLLAGQGSQALAWITHWAWLETLIRNLLRWVWCLN